MSELANFIKSKCNLPKKVVDELKRCGITMDLLLNIEREELKCFCVKLDEATVDKICDCIRNEFQNDSSCTEQSDTSSTLDFSDKYLGKRKRMSKRIQSKNKVENTSKKKSLEMPPYTIPNCSTSMRLEFDTISSKVLKKIIEDSLEGIAILGEYEKNQILDQGSRKLLVSLIVNRCTPPLTYGAVTFFEKVAKCIKELFPKEDINIYFVAPNSLYNNSRNAQGLLIVKWRSILHRMRKAGILVKKAQCLNQRRPEVEHED